MKSENSDKNDEMNIDYEDNIDVGDFGSNLNVYSGSKGESRRVEAEKS